MQEEESVYPTPKLDALFKRPEVFETPEPVQKVLAELHKIINPMDHVKWDWEVLHSMEDEVFRKAIAVLLDYPEHRERILLLMSQVVDLKIPRW